MQAEEAVVRGSGVWSELVEQLGLGVPLEEGLARAAARCEVESPLSSQLPVYRWLQQALDTAPNHPLLPLFWQRFFQCYLVRPVAGAGSGVGEEPRGVGAAFFAGIRCAMRKFFLLFAVNWTTAITRVPTLSNFLCRDVE